MPKIVGRPLLLFFVGSGRTGSTLLGVILNHHPMCLIANEARLVRELLQEPERKNQLVMAAADLAWRQFRTGLEHDEHFSARLDHFQPRWRSFASLPTHGRFQKGPITVIGDKKAGGAVQAMEAMPQRTTEFFSANAEVRLVQCLRHPADIARSMMRSHGFPSFQDAADHAIGMAAAADKWCRAIGERAIRVRYEELIAHPAGVLEGVCGFLQLPVDSVWLEEVCRRVGPSPPAGSTTEDLQICRDLIAKHRAAPLFAVYGL